LATNRFKGEKQKVIRHLEAATYVGSDFNWHDDLFCIHLGLADETELDDAEAHTEPAKSRTARGTWVCKGYGDSVCTFRRIYQTGDEKPVYRFPR
jgi:hypothetical protein